MADFYSDHYSADQGQTGHFTTLLTAQQRTLVVGKKHARLRRTACYISVPNAQDLADNDVIRFFDMKSGDRPIQLFASMDANWGATASFNLGLYLKGTNDDGAVIDEDLFASAVDWSGTIARTEYLVESSVLDEWDRGKTLWELADIGDGTYTTDPFQTWTVASTFASNPSATDALVEMLVEMIYVAND